MKAPLRSLQSCGFVRPKQTSGFLSSSKTTKKVRKGVSFTIDTESIKLLDNNLDALVKYLGALNLKPILEANADRYIVHRVKGAIRAAGAISKEAHYYYPKGRTRVKIHPGNLLNSYQVLKHRKRLRKGPSVFVGPKAIYKGGKAKSYGQNPKRANAYYAPARESRFGEIIMPAVKRNARAFIMANARDIKRMIR
jgi:hypothetical protein